MSELGPAPDYTEGHGPIVWRIDPYTGRFIEPRDQGWIPQIQAAVDARRAAKRAFEQEHFDAWEREMDQL